MSLFSAVHSTSEKKKYTGGQRWGGGDRGEVEGTVCAQIFSHVCGEGWEGYPCRKVFWDRAFLPVMCCLLHSCSECKELFIGSWLWHQCAAGWFFYSLHWGVVAPSFHTTAMARSIPTSLQSNPSAKPGDTLASAPAYGSRFGLYDFQRPLPSQTIFWFYGKLFHWEQVRFLKSCGWKCSRTGWIELWSTWSSGRSPSPWEGFVTEWF